MGVDESTISLWINSKRGIDWDKYGRKMARLLNLTKEEFEEIV